MPKNAPAPKRAASPSVEKKDDDAPPPRSAKKQMCSIFDEPAPPPMRKMRANKGGDGNSTALCKIQGVVTRTKDETVNGPRGPIPKKRIDLVVTGIIANGAQDIIRTGVEGENFIFPSKQIDTPEQAEAGGEGKFKAKARELIVSPMQKVRKLSTFSSAFYKEGKEGGDTGVNACEPGMLVEISGVCVNAVVNKTSGATNFYLNGGKVTCLMDKAPSPGELPRHMIELNKQEKMMEWSAFAASIPMKGFFDSDQQSVMNPAQKAQAVACQAMWQRLVEGTADRLGIMAQGKDEDMAGQINGHEQRIRASAPEKVAGGDISLFLIDQYDCTIAPIAQSGVTPWNRTPEMIQLLNSGPEGQAKVPQTFTAPWVVNVEVTGKALSVDMRVAFIFDKDQAIEALENGDLSPVLASSTAAIPMSLSLRDHAVKLGSLLEGKVAMGCRELLPVAEFAAFPKMANIEEGGQDAIKTDFPEGGTLYINMHKTLQHGSLLVSEGFVKANLCGGGATFVPPKVKAEVSKLDFPAGVTDMPDLEGYTYQELTYASFDFGNWETESLEPKFRVVFPGVLGRLKDDEALTTDTAKAEALLKSMGHDTPLKMKKFLTEECLVYAVLP